MHIFRHIFLSNYWWQRSDIWSQASYRYAILWEAFLDPSESYFLFADLVGFYTHWTYMHIFRHIFLSNYWWQKSDIWSQALYRYPILWEAFFDPSDSYFLFAEERGHHKWALAHSSSCYFIYIWFKLMLKFLPRYFMPYSEVIWHSDVHASRRVWQISDELTHGWWNRNLCPQICDMHIQTCTNEDPPGSIGIKPLVAQVLYRLQWRK